MLSSLNSFGGLSSAELLTLFGANSSSSSSTTPKSTAPSASTGISGSSANDPANAIQAILAQAQTATSGGGWASSLTAEAAYASEAGGSSSILSASVTVSSPDAVRQISDAVSFINNFRAIYQAEPGDVEGPVTVTAADALNVTISNGAVSATAMQGASFPNGLPSLASIQQALSELKWQDQGTGWNGVEATAESTASEVDDAWWNSVGGGSTFTLVKLPPSSLVGRASGGIATFSTGDANWALVLPQNSVSVTVSDTESAG